MERFKIAVWAQNTTQAGRRAWAIEDAENWESDDVVVYEGSIQDIRDYATGLDKAAETAGAGTDLFNRHVARTLRQAIDE